MSLALLFSVVIIFEYSRLRNDKLSVLTIVISGLFSSTDVADFDDCKSIKLLPLSLQPPPPLLLLLLPPRFNVDDVVGIVAVGIVVVAVVVEFSFCNISLTAASFCSSLLSIDDKFISPLNDILSGPCSVDKYVANVWTVTFKNSAARNRVISFLRNFDNTSAGPGSDQKSRTLNILKL